MVDLIGDGKAGATVLATAPPPPNNQSLEMRPVGLTYHQTVAVLADGAIEPRFPQNMLTLTAKDGSKLACQPRSLYRLRDECYISLAWVHEADSSENLQGGEYCVLVLAYGGFSVTLYAELKDALDAMTKVILEDE